MYEGLNIACLYRVGFNISSQGSSRRSRGGHSDATETIGQGVRWPIPAQTRHAEVDFAFLLDLWLAFAVSLAPFRLRPTIANSLLDIISANTSLLSPPIPDPLLNNACFPFPFPLDP